MHSVYLATLCSFALFASVAHAADGTITFRGMIVEGACVATASSRPDHPQLSGCKAAVAQNTRVTVQAITRRSVATVIGPDHTQRLVVTVEYL